MNDPRIPRKLLALADADSDPEESAEWREAFVSVLQAAGQARVRELMDMLASLARDPSVGWQPTICTAGFCSLR